MNAHQRRVTRRAREREAQRLDELGLHQQATAAAWGDVALRMPRGHVERRKARLRALLAPHKATMRRLAAEDG